MRKLKLKHYDTIYYIECFEQETIHDVKDILKKKYSFIDPIFISRNDEAISDNVDILDLFKNNPDENSSANEGNLANNHNRKSKCEIELIIDGKLLQPEEIVKEESAKKKTQRDYLAEFKEMNFPENDITIQNALQAENNDLPKAMACLIKSRMKRDQPIDSVQSNDLNPSSSKRSSRTSSKKKI